MDLAVVCKSCDVFGTARLLLLLHRDHILHSAPLRNYRVSDLLMQQYSQYALFHNPVYCRDRRKINKNIIQFYLVDFY